MPTKVVFDSQCPIARSMERVGEWWSILILRDAMQGLTRFDQFQKSLGIAPNMLTRRLASLVDGGLLVKQQYCERPPRDEYLLTARGNGFKPVLVALLSWGNREFAREGIAVQIINKATGEPADPILVDRKTGRPLSEELYEMVPGPAANERMLGRLAFMAREKQARQSENQAASSRASKSRRTSGDKASTARARRRES